MRKIVLLFIILLANAFASSGQNYLFEFDLTFDLMDRSNEKNHEFHLYSAEYTTFNGNKASITGLLFSGIEDQFLRKTGTMRIPVANGFIKDITLDVERKVWSSFWPFSRWSSACKDNALVIYRSTSSATTCFNLAGQNIDWSCLWHGASITTFRCYPEVTIASDKRELTDEGKLVVQATAGFPSQVYKWKYSISDAPGIWKDVPPSCYNNGRFEASAVDLLGATEALNALGKQVILWIDLGCGMKSNALTIDVRRVCPGIVSVTTADVKCPGEATGSILLNLDREIAPFETVEVAAYTADGIEGNRVAYEKIDNKTLRINNLYKGIYTVKIFSFYRDGDKNYAYAEKPDGTNVRGNIEIKEPSPVVFELDQKQPVKCNGESNGSFKVIISGGTSGYKLLWRAQGAIGFNETAGTEVGNLPAGIYEFRVIDANGCEPRDQEGFLIIKEVELTEPEPISLICPDDRLEKPSGNGLSNGSITVQVEGGTPNYTVVWKNKDTGAIQTDVENGFQGGIFESKLKNIPAGDYIITVTDANGCSRSLTITLDEPFAIKGVIVQTQYILCHGDANAALEVTSVTGGIPGTGGIPYLYEWYKITSPTDSVYIGNQTSIIGLGPGKYVVTIKDFSDPVNKKDLYYDIYEPDSGSATLASVNVSCYGGSDGSITVNVSGGSKPYKLFYSQGGAAYSNVSFSTATYTLNNMPAGVYNVYIKDNNNCSAKINGNDIETVTITQPASELVVVAQRVKHPTGAGRSDGAITIRVSGGLPFASDPKYQAVWRNSSGIIVGKDSTDGSGNFLSSINNLPKGIYTVQVNGQTHPGSSGACTVNLQFELKEPLPLTAGWQATPVSCHGKSDGTITVLASGGVPNEITTEPPYLYEWYVISTGVPALIPGEKGAALSNIGAGKYRVKVTDFSDPPNTKEFDYTLTEPDDISVAVSETPVSCFEGNNGTIKVNVTGGTSPYYLYYKKVSENNYSELSAVNGIFTVANLISGDYELYVKDKNDCPVLINGEPIDTVTITQPDSALTIANQIIRPPSGKGKADGYIILTITGGTPFTTGSAYKVVWFNESGYPIDAVNAVSDVTGLFTTTITGLPKGVYTVEIKDSLYYGKPGNCYLNLSITLDEPGPISVVLENTKTVDCFGDHTGELVAHVSGGLPFLSGTRYKYRWYKIENEDILLENQNDSILSGLGAGLYKVIVEDSGTPPNVNTEIPIFEIDQPDELITNLTKNDISCYGGRNGRIEISVSGGVGNYVMYAKRENVDSDFKIITWNNGNNRFLMDSLYAGIYKVYIQDANLCYAKIDGEEIATIGLTQPDRPLTIDSVKTVNPSAYGFLNGSIQIKLSGGTPFPDSSYTVIWKTGGGKVLKEEHAIAGGSYVSTVNNLPAGNYFVEIRDANYFDTEDAVSNQACIAMDEFTLTEPDPFEAELKETYISCFGKADGELTAFARGGVVNPEEGLPYLYQWYQQNEKGEYIPLSGKNESKLTHLSGGHFKLEITDYSWLPNVIILTYNLVEPEPLIVSAIGAEVACGETATVSTEVSGGTPPYTYQWSTGAETSSLQGMYPGIYMVFVTDSRGCNTIASARVTGPGDVHLTGEVFDPICYDGSNGQVIVTVTGGTEPYTYQWSDGSKNRDLIDVKAGFYTVTVFDRDGCAYSESFELKNPEPLKLDLGDDQILCIGQTYEPDPAVEDPASTFLWTSNNGFRSTERHVKLDRAGTYRLTITDSKGCQATDIFAIETKDYNISCEMAVASATALNDTIVLVNISHPDPDRIEWIFSPDDPIEIVETTPELAMLIFKREGEYKVGMRSFVSDCFQDVYKIITVTKPGEKPAEELGPTDIKRFIAYPNPNTGAFQADVELDKPANIRLRLISLAQGTILSSKTQTGSDKYSVPYNETLTSGAYILMLETPTSTRSLKLIIY